MPIHSHRHYLRTISTAVLIAAPFTIVACKIGEPLRIYGNADGSKSAPKTADASKSTAGTPAAVADESPRSKNPEACVAKPTVEANERNLEGLSDLRKEVADLQKEVLGSAAEKKASFRLALAERALVHAKSLELKEGELRKFVEEIVAMDARKKPASQAPASGNAAASAAAATANAAPGWTQPTSAPGSAQPPASEPKQEEPHPGVVALLAHMKAIEHGRALFAKPAELRAFADKVMRHQDGIAALAAHQRLYKFAQEAQRPELGKDEALQLANRLLDAPNPADLAVSFEEIFAYEVKLGAKPADATSAAKKQTCLAD